MLAGLVGGIGSTVLIAVINSALRKQEHSTATLAQTFIVFCVAVPVARFFSQALLERLTARAALNLRIELGRRILSSPLRLLEELGSHNLLAALTDDVTSITNAVGTIPVLSMNIALVVACLIYLGWLSWLMLLSVMVFLILFLIVYQTMLAVATRYLLSGRDSWGTLIGHFRALTDGAKELKMHKRRREAFFSEVLDPTAESLRRSYLVGRAVQAAASSTGQTLFFALIGLIIFVLPSTLPTISHANVGTLMSFTVTLLYMVGPLDAITQSFIGLGHSKVALQKVENLGFSLSSKNVESDSAIVLNRPLLQKCIELKGVTHAYRSDESKNSFTLGPIDLSLSAGDVVFLVGGNGSGKTTLLKLMTGLYMPEAGEIRFDGQLVDDQNREQFRQYFSTVFSDFHLFESLLGMDTPELDINVQNYLAQFQLEHKVQVRDGSLSTTSLSHGQRKRLALLTAYMEDRPVYIFDEWAADQDPRFKRIFYLEFLAELKARGKTVVVISHDDRYYCVADRIIKLENGQLEYDERVNGLSTRLRGDFNDTENWRAAVQLN